jgi:hypothetical protein
VTGDPNIRFYGGRPVAGRGGEVLGTLCVLDDRPRAEGEVDPGLLRELAEMVEAEVASLSLAIGDELTGRCAKPPTSSSAPGGLRPDRPGRRRLAVRDAAAERRWELHLSLGVVDARGG